MQNTTVKRNVIADALRGAAGLLVPLFHISEPYGWQRADAAAVPQVCGHGYLCVEFFLLLMGYMLAYAYDRRWKEGMGIGTFFGRRLLRLHPLVVSGTVIGLIVFFAQGAGVRSGTSRFGRSAHGSSQDWWRRASCCCRIRARDS